MKEPLDRTLLSSPRRRATCCLLGLTLSMLSTRAAAEDAHDGASASDAEETAEPSIAAGAFRGLVAGGLAGLGSSYLVVRDGGVSRDQGEWRAIGLGLGVGALTGAGLGIALGAADRSGACGGRYVARDMVWGAGFGMLLGGIGGGISAVAKGDGERAVRWASIGALAGTSLGLLTGVIEGQAKRERNERRTEHTMARVRLAPSLALPVAPDGRLAAGFAPGVRGTF